MNEKATTVQRRIPSRLLLNAREMRKNPTEAEKALWFLLRKRNVKGKFRRQHPISEGFILDFYCVELKLAIELDGEVHNNTEEAEYDRQRTEALVRYGIKVIRFSNEEVLNSPQTVLNKIKSSPRHSSPLPSGRGVGGEE